MYFSDRYNIKIKMYMDNGVYRLPRESAIGKTYLVSILKFLKGGGEPVMSLTHNDVCNGEELSYFIKYKDYKVVMLDRYDMYSGRFEDEIFELGKTAIVLLDAKLMPLFKPSNGDKVKIAYFKFNGEEMELR